MQRIHFACSVFLLSTLLVAVPSRSAASDQESLLERDGKKLICTVLFQASLDVDCGTESYDAVFTAKILAVSQLHRSSGQHVRVVTGPTSASDARLRRSQAMSVSNGRALPIARELMAAN